MDREPPTSLARVEEVTAEAGDDSVKPLREDNVANEMGYKYPATDPSTWNPDYSPNYQDLFLNARILEQNAMETSTATRRNTSDWQPSMARLHPEIEAPPIR